MRYIRESSPYEFRTIFEFEYLYLEEIEALFKKKKIKAEYNVDPRDNFYFILPNFFSDGRKGDVRLSLEPRGFIRCQVNAQEIYGFDKRKADNFIKWLDGALDKTRR